MSLSVTVLGESHCFSDFPGPAGVPAENSSRVRSPAAPGGVNRLRVHTVDSEGQTQWVFMLSCYARMQRLRHSDLQSDTEQKTDPSFALHFT